MQYQKTQPWPRPPAMPTERAPSNGHPPCTLRRLVSSAVRTCAWLTWLASATAAAGPWMDPGDLALRHDVELLADAGVVRVPVTTWPLAWADVAQDLEDYQGSLTPAVAGARGRLMRQYRLASRVHEVIPQLRVAVADHPRQFRTFADTPREDAELETGVEWTGADFAYRVKMAAVDASADDHKTLRFDGSYLAAIWGNWAISAGEQPRWWGPGWEGSLIWSTNARPIPAVTVQRHLSAPFETPLLHWLGPWQFLFSLGQLEGSRDVPHALFLGMRFSFRPTRSFELGMSRTAQWGGQGRPEGFSTFKDLLLGYDNVGSAGITRANEPGNQLAGFDARWESPLFHGPYALYAQWTGEDEAGGWPSRYIGLFGIETWGAIGHQGASWRLHTEYADTATGGFYGSTLFNYAYQHHIYTSGYTYYGRTIGDSLGGDGRSSSLDLLLVGANGNSWDVLVRRMEPHRNVAGTPLYDTVEVGRQFKWYVHRIDLRLGAVHRRQPDNNDTQLQADAQWTWMF